MGKIENVSVKLSDELVDATNAAVAGGEFASLDHVVQAALAEWMQRRDRDLAKVRALIEEGIASGFEPHDGMADIMRAGQGILADRKA
ncbi:MAG: type II toxin-antitoxin system ParD family antitoxin [Sphingomonadales bacterium]|nr:type II toxin-antitoxin system ParD family antitoxin [Sphingomonadales bacterium]